MVRIWGAEKTTPQNGGAMLRWTQVLPADPGAASTRSRHHRTRPPEICVGAQAVLPGQAADGQWCSDISAAIYADLVVAQVMLARRFGRDAADQAPGWRGWRPWLLASSGVTAGRHPGAVRRQSGTAGQPSGPAGQDSRDARLAATRG